MKVMVVGGGGREHAIIKKLKENKEITELYALPGNGGISFDAQCVDIKAVDVDGIVDFAVKNNVDYAVVAPDDPLVLGCVDKLAEAGIAAFGPKANAAILEGSKAFSKALMKKYHIPTAEYEIFSDAAEAAAYIERKNTYPIVVKADGLALGKGVMIAQNHDEALAAVKTIMQDKAFGKSGDTVVVEEFLTGPEVSVLCFTDGKTLRPMASSMDHKRALDGDKGLNTGGMGTVAPNPFYSPAIAEQCMKTIFQPTIDAMNAEGRPFSGCLYFGLMLTAEGPKVIEYNCRFGDPETQVVLPLLKSDLYTVMRACTDGTLDKTAVEFAEGCAACVVIASGGYPQKYVTGYEIVGLDQKGGVPGAEVYHAGTAVKDGKLYTAGGRVMGVSAMAKDLSAAIDKAYRAAGRVHFKDMHIRRDIGKRALTALTKED